MHHVQLAGWHMQRHLLRSGKELPTGIKSGCKFKVPVAEQAQTHLLKAGLLQWIAFSMISAACWLACSNERQRQ
jgi:hypothetical protein